MADKKKGNNNNQQEEVKKEEVLEFAPQGLYSPHFTEQTLVRVAEEKILDAVLNITGKSCSGMKWNKPNHVYGILPWGDVAKATVTLAKGGKQDVTAKAEFNPDKKEVYLILNIGDKICREVMKHFSIKHGFIRYNDLYADDTLKIIEDNTPEDNSAPAYLNPRQKFMRGGRKTQPTNTQRYTAPEIYYVGENW